MTAIDPTDPSNPAVGLGQPSHAGFATGADTDVPPGIGPYALGWRRLKRNKVALAALGVFVVMVVLCMLAPVYAKYVAHTGPSINHPDQLSNIGIPNGPTWHAKYFLGVDQNGRDVAVRLLYGGRNSLEIGFIAAFITMFLAVLLGVVAGYKRGWADALISRGFDLLWAYPVVLLGVALGTAIAVGGLNLGLFQVNGNSLFVPAVIIGVVYAPYVGKPLRGQVLGLREKEFVDAARAQGLSSRKIMMSEILPNLASTLIVFVPLILANAILLEAGLSYLGAGVQTPNSSWGTMISDGLRFFPAAFHTVLVPGLMLVITILAINIFGDGVRDALDPRSKVRIER